MRGCQLDLIAPTRPLLDRLGSGFFQKVPRGPGVYIMSGPENEILYVGQSGDLRTRLGHYKNARLGKAPRKVVRLAHKVSSITWEICETRTAAILRENELLRLHRPKFNRANVYPQAYSFVLCHFSPGTLELEWSNEPGPAARTFGAFKSLQFSFGALTRHLWRILMKPTCLQDYSPRLLLTPPQRRFSFSNVSNETTTQQLIEFLSGRSDDLLTSSPPLSCSSKFEVALDAADREILTTFYRGIARRNAGLNTVREQPRLVMKEELDDLLALSKSHGEPEIGPRTT